MDHNHNQLLLPANTNAVTQFHFIALLCFSFQFPIDSIHLRGKRQRKLNQTKPTVHLIVAIIKGGVYCNPSIDLC